MRSCARHTTHLALVTFLSTAAALAQAAPSTAASPQPAKPLSYDVVSIRPNRTGANTTVDNSSRGLTGRYTFGLKWQWDEPATRIPAFDEAAAPSGLPDLPTALEEQLGLKFTPTKLATTVLVIDHIDRPTEN